MTTSKVVNATIEILGKFYPIRCGEEEIPSLTDAASLLNQRMSEVQASGKVINLERIAIISALNLANELLQQSQQKGSIMTKINQHITNLQDKIDSALKKPVQTELAYQLED